MQTFLLVFNEYLDIVLVALVAALFSLIERGWPNEDYGWNGRWLLQTGGLALLGVLLTLATGNGFESAIEKHRIVAPFSHYLNALPHWAAGFIGYLAVTFFIYWWHRARHASNLLWRVFHQIHHSPQRIQAITAFYAHPADFICNTLIINLVAYILLGLDIDGAAWTAVWVGIFEVWEHANISTPRWLGYLIVRPEMHRIHHERDKHTNNYGLPIWDMIFGTYENSLRRVDCGFDAALENRLVPMLMTKDVHKTALNQYRVQPEQGQ